MSKKLQHFLSHKRWTMLIWALNEKRRVIKPYFVFYDSKYTNIKNFWKEMHKTLTGIYERWYLYGHFHFTFQNVQFFPIVNTVIFKKRIYILCKWHSSTILHFVQPPWVLQDTQRSRGTPAQTTREWQAEGSWKVSKGKSGRTSLGRGGGARGRRGSARERSAT